MKKMNINLELNNKELCKKNTKLESQFEKVQKELTDLKELFSKTMIQKINKQQEKFDKIDILLNIKERDNYNAFLYMILVSLGNTFESIWIDIKNIVKSDKKLKLDNELLNLFNQLSSIILFYNEEAHESIKENIYKNLFHNSNQNLKKFFPDETVNATKEIIRGLKNYVNRKKDDQSFKEFEEKINKITKEIREIFKIE